MVTPFNTPEFEHFIEDISSKAPLKKEAVKQAGHFWQQITGLTSQEKERTITTVQKAIQNLHSRLSTLKSVTLADDQVSDVTKKIEVLRTVLFGTKLEKVPSYQRFQALMELTNRFADTLTAHPEYSCTPVEVEIAGTKWTAWQLEGHYLLLGCADSMQGIPLFSDTLLASNYHETLCISAINEDTSYYREEQKVFLLLHVDPRTVVHTEEQDMGTPRFKENTMQERTEWYDTARRMMEVSSEIDTAHSRLRTLLNHVVGSSDIEIQPYTTLDTFNRLAIQLHDRLDPLGASVEDRLNKYLKNPTPNNETELFNAIYENEDLSDIDQEALEELLTAYTQAARSLKTEIVRAQIIDTIEEIDLEDKELILQALRGEVEIEESKAEQLANEYQLPNIAPEDFESLLLGETLRQSVDISELDKYRHLVSRPRLILNELMQILAPIDSQSSQDRLTALFPKLDDKISRASKKEREELIQAKEYLKQALDPKALYKMLFPASTEGSQNIREKLYSLEQQLRRIPPSFKGISSDSTKEVEFLTSPNRLLSPETLTSQTSELISPDEHDWNEINLDLEATGGGKTGGVYPTGIVISQKVLNNLSQIERLNLGSRAQLNALFTYAKDHSLPIFIKP